MDGSVLRGKEDDDATGEWMSLSWRPSSSLGCILKYR